MMMLRSNIIEAAKSLLIQWEIAARSMQFTALCTASQTGMVGRIYVRDPYVDH